MAGYIKWYDEAPKWLRIVVSVFGIFAFLYRLFKVIIDKAEDTSKLIYVIFNVIPIIGTVIVVFDIVKCAMGKALPTNFSEMADFSDESKKEVVDEQNPSEEK